MNSVVLPLCARLLPPSRAYNYFLCSVWPFVVQFWNMASSFVNGLLKKMYIYNKHIYMCKGRTYSFILYNFLFKNLRAMLLILAIFSFTSLPCLFPPMPLSVLCRYFKSIPKQNNILLMAHLFQTSVYQGQNIFWYCFHCDALESKRWQYSV